jgi:type IV pilus assembly protein PilO
MPNTALNKIIKLPDSQKIAMLLFLLAALTAAYVYYVFIPQREYYASQKESMLKLEAKYNEQQSILSNLPRFQQELKILQLAFEDALKMLPNAREIPNLITSISTHAQEAGLEILLFQPKPEVSMDFYAQIPVQMKVTGRYPQIGVFFDKLSKLPRIINIEDLQIISRQTKQSKSSSIILLDASFNATTFKFIEKTGAPDADKKTKATKKTKKK